VPASLDVINPATEKVISAISVGSSEDVNKAVAAARAAFPTFSDSSKETRLELLRRVLACYNAREDDIAYAVSVEMGSPITAAHEAQVWAGRVHIEGTIAALEAFQFETDLPSGTRIVKEGIGVVSLITPWNWTMNQIVCKVAPALATGCTMVLKPSEIAPLSGIVFAEIMVAAGCPPGVFNMVNGDGPSVGAPMSRHPEVDMVSFTGSVRAGALVAKEAANTVKRVCQELGGKSPNLILDDVEDLAAAVSSGVENCFDNTGQNCDAATRLLVPRHLHAQALVFAKAAAEKCVIGDPLDKATTMGPLVSGVQWEKVQALIQVGIDEGGTLVCGGVGKPGGEATEAGYFVKPTIFGGVVRTMTLANEEVFGPVLVIMPYDDDEEAVSIANDSVYGLAAFISSGNLEHAQRIGKRLRAGQVNINNPDWDTGAPFGGYKQSGNGREYGVWGIHDYLETKAIIGFAKPKSAETAGGAAEK